MNIVCRLLAFKDQSECFTLERCVQMESRNPFFMHGIEKKPEKNHKSCLCKEKPFHILQSFNSVYFMCRVKFKKVPKLRMDDLHNDGK